jgi:RND family efflux transporter MFP subunit
MKSLGTSCGFLAWICLCAEAVPAAQFDCITEPSQVVEIRAAVDGLIDHVYVDRGDMVKAGQILATLDSGLEKASAELARFKSTMKGAQQSGESRLEYAGVKAQRNEQLLKEHFVSSQERDEAVTERRLAEAQLVETRDNQSVAALEYQHANEQLRLRTVRSPVDGVVVQRLMSVGEFADSRDQRRPIVKLANLSQLYVEALLPLEAHGKVRPGQLATISPQSPPGSQFTARVKVVDKIVDAASSTFGVRLELANSKLEIPAGVKCRVSFPELSLSKGTRQIAP